MLYHVTAEVVVDADSAEEGMAIVNAAMPSTGSIRIHGTVGLVTSVTTGGIHAGKVSPPAVIIDAQDLRDEMTDDDVWTEKAWQAIDQMPDSTLNDVLRDGFNDDFWAAVSDVRIEAIGYLLDEAGVPPDERRTAP